LTDAPFLLVVAGPNGSGKSTLTRSLVEAGIDFGIHINPDDIAQTLELPEPQRTAQARQSPISSATPACSDERVSASRRSCRIRAKSKS
jgi:predicted ABC-type ATPase